VEKLDELIDSNSSMSNDGSECAAVEFFVVGHHNLAERRVPAKNHVTGFLSLEIEANPLEGFHALSP